MNIFNIARDINGIQKRIEMRAQEVKTGNKNILDVSSSDFYRSEREKTLKARKEQLLTSARQQGLFLDQVLTMYNNFGEDLMNLSGYLTDLTRYTDGSTEATALKEQIEGAMKNMRNALNIQIDGVTPFKGSDEEAATLDISQQKVENSPMTLNAASFNTVASGSKTNFNIGPMEFEIRTAATASTSTEYTAKSEQIILDFNNISVSALTNAIQFLDTANAVTLQINYISGTSNLAGNILSLDISSGTNPKTPSELAKELQDALTSGVVNNTYDANMRAIGQNFEVSLDGAKLIISKKATDVSESTAKSNANFRIANNTPNLTMSKKSGSYTSSDLVGMNSLDTKNILTLASGNLTPGDVLTQLRTSLNGNIKGKELFKIDTTTSTTDITIVPNAQGTKVSAKGAALTGILSSSYISLENVDGLNTPNVSVSSSKSNIITNTKGSKTSATFTVPNTVTTINRTDTVTFNGVTFTFVDEVTGDNQIQISKTTNNIVSIPRTLQTLVDNMNRSKNANVRPFSFSIDPSNPNGILVSSRNNMSGSLDNAAGPNTSVVFSFSGTNFTVTNQISGREDDNDFSSFDRSALGVMKVDSARLNGTDVTLKVFFDGDPMREYTGVASTTLAQEKVVFTSNDGSYFTLKIDSSNISRTAEGYQKALNDAEITISGVTPLVLEKIQGAKDYFSNISFFSSKRVIPHIPSSDISISHENQNTQVKLGDFTASIAGNTLTTGQKIVLNNAKDSSYIELQIGATAIELKDLPDVKKILENVFSNNSGQYSIIIDDGENKQTVVFPDLLAVVKELEEKIQTNPYDPYILNDTSKAFTLAGLFVKNTKSASSVAVDRLNQGVNASNEIIESRSGISSDLALAGYTETSNESERNYALFFELIARNRRINEELNRALKQ